ncbi:hypothetical protein AMTR_s00002p00061820 [Amborella trichopoda]|uniref:Uncharacterized protein n=1 Tax=Amborella trichopoda TaxID=13333 RepID=W1NZ65_AMBTC|nr:hypothetical protein AMTR_s00002p00061820 [Amborella trichopoda]
MESKTSNLIPQLAIDPLKIGRANGRLKQAGDSSYYYLPPIAAVLTRLEPIATKSPPPQIKLVLTVALGAVAPGAKA